MILKKSVLAIAITLTAALSYPVATVSQASPLPTAPQKVVLRQTKHVDVDGDHRLDTVRVYNAGTQGDNTTWKVKVTTATGKVSSVTFPIPTYQTNKPWYGWANLDGRRGAELLFETHTDDGLGLEVLRWQAGKLVRVKSPVSPSALTQEWGGWFAVSESDISSGYRFFTSGGKGYVDAWDADCPEADGSKPCTVKTIRSVWRSGSWHKVRTLATQKISTKIIFTRLPLSGAKIH
jgi:hypothetical protein